MLDLQDGAGNLRVAGLSDQPDRQVTDRGASSCPRVMTTISRQEAAVLARPGRGGARGAAATGIRVLRGLEAASSPAPRALRRSPGRYSRFARSGAGSAPYSTAPVR